MADRGHTCTQTPHPLQTASSISAFFVSLSHLIPGHPKTLVQYRLQPHSSPRHLSGFTLTLKRAPSLVALINAHSRLQITTFGPLPPCKILRNSSLVCFTS